MQYKVSFYNPNLTDFECEGTEALDEKIRKTYPNAVYTDPVNNLYTGGPPDQSALFFFWRNEKHRDGKYGTGQPSHEALGEITREDVTGGDRWNLAQQPKEKW